MVKINTLRIYKLSDKFVSFLTDSTAGFIEPAVLDRFIETVENEIKNHYFTYSSEGNLYRIINASFDKTAFLHGCVDYPYYVEILVIISVNSNYLSDILVVNPEYFYWIINPENLNNQLDEAVFYNQVMSSVNSYKNFETKVNSLRRIKRKEILRTALNDLLGNSNLQRTTFNLSIMARVLTGVLFELCYNEVLSKYSVTNIKNSYCLVSLGKLGGNELNYSSDIDLILFFDRNSKTGGRDYFEILNETVKLFIEKASVNTGTGYLFRIDFRLRPDGRNSLLCRTLQDYLAYYESRGEDWERQMLIKSSFCMGDYSLFQKFINYLRPFIYPSSFVTSPFEQIVKLKNNIEKNVKDENVKLFSGGIRDIEFSVQALQLINGGKIPELRTGTTLNALDVLKQSGLINKNEHNTFYEAYILYRRIEHFLQLMNDKQTHTIPESGEELEQLSFFLGFKSSDEFKQHIKVTRKKVRNIYKSIAGLESEQEIFTDIRFDKIKKAEADLLYLRTGKGLLAEKTFDINTIESFLKIENRLFDFLKTSPDPDRTLSSFARVIRNINLPGLWYNSFSNAHLFNDFLTLCTYSIKSIDLFAEDADLKEFFITKKAYEKLNPSKLKSYSLKQILFVLSSQFILRLINESQVSNILSSYLINRISEIISEENISVSYLVAAAGSLGNSEMNFSSDIDLLIICREENDLPSMQKIFQNILNKIKLQLKPFEADCRLRPEGKSSYLVWSIDSQVKYLSARARIWEIQSFTKLKFISGDKGLFRDINKAVIRRIKSENKEFLRKEMLEMRKKLAQGISSKEFINIKKDSGGLLDIEFMIQYLLLRKPELFRKYQGKKYNQVLLSLAELLNIKDFHTVADNYLFMKKILIANQCILNSTGYKISFGNPEMKLIKAYLNAAHNEKEVLSIIFRNNNFAFNKYTGI